MVWKYAGVVDRSNAVGRCDCAGAGCPSTPNVDPASKPVSGNPLTAQAGDAIGKLLHKCRAALQRVVASAGQGDPHGEQARRLEARIDGAQPDETANQQSCADEHDHRQRHFSHYQRVAQQASAASGSAAAPAFVERRIEVRARAVQRGDGAEHNSGEQRDPQGEQEQPDVDSGEREARNARDIGVRQNADDAGRQQQAQQTAAKGQQDAFGEQLGNDAPAPGAERGTQRDFAAARCAAR